jgi:hypothetical protein
MNSPYVCTAEAGALVDDAPPVAPPAAGLGSPAAEHAEESAAATIVKASLVAHERAMCCAHDGQIGISGAGGKRRRREGRVRTFASAPPVPPNPAVPQPGSKNNLTVCQSLHFGATP